MKKIKSGKEEIIYLLSKAIEKYKLETGQEIVQNTNRKNYEALAITLSDISNQLPNRADELGTDAYTPDLNQKGYKYPYRKYDITGGQIKDALIGIVSHPRPFLVDACYVYLYGVGRKKFEANPLDDNLLEKSEQNKINEAYNAENVKKQLQQQISLLHSQDRNTKKKLKIALLIASIFFVVLIATIIAFYNSNNGWATIKKDMNILPYQPTKTEIDSLEGIWLCYTGSPQARISDPNRYHKVVPNLIEVKYKNGYFIYNRFGASFDHIGYMQFEAPNLVSIYSKVKNDPDSTESPRHSLLNLNSNKKYLAAISASWSFDVGERNKIIGIREVYVKQGTGGHVEEVINEIENASCQCKIIKWHQLNNQVKTYYLKNELLDSLNFKDIRPLINENSILLNEPQNGLIISKDSISQKF